MTTGARNLGGTDDLVGRGTVMAELDRAKQVAARGVPTVVALLGDAGSGKTALLRAFLRSCGQRSEVSLGSAQEDIGVPYLALSHLLGMLDVSPGQAPTSTDRDSEWALWRSVTAGVGRRARDHLIVIGIDDLHWADAASIRLIEHLATALSDEAVVNPIRCLLVLSSRSGGRDSAAMRLLSRCGDGPGGKTIRLAGLDETAITSLVGMDTGLYLTPTEARDVHRRTGGNPLLVRLLAPSLGSSASAGTVPSGLYNPHVLADQWDRRLGDLPAPVRRLLDAASIQGDPVDPAVTAFVIGCDPATHLFDLAASAGLLVEDVEGWHLAFPELGRHLRLSLSASQQERLHALTAEALVARRQTDQTGRSPSALLALDHHLQRAGSHANPDVVLTTAAEAGSMALRMGAWSRAVDAFATVLPRVDELPGDDRAHTLVMVDAANALIMDSQPGVAVPVLTKAIALAEQSGATGLWGDVLTRAVRNRLSGPPPDRPWPEVAQLRLYAEREGDPVPRALAWVTLADVAFVAADPAEGAVCCAHARRLAELADSSQTLAFVEYAEGLQHLGQLRARAAAACFARCGDLAATSEDDVLTSWWKVRLPLSEYLSGNIPAAARHLDEAVDHCRRAERWADQSLAEAYRSGVAAMGGHFAEAEARAEHALVLHRRTGYSPAASVAFPQLVCVKALQGDTDGVSEVAEAMAAEIGAPRWLSALARLEGGATEPERRSPGPGRAVHEINLATLLSLVARGLLADPADVTTIAAVAKELQVAFERGTVWASGWTLSVPRALAGLAMRLGDVDGASRWLGLAADATERSRADAEGVQIDLLSAAIARAEGQVRPATTACLRALEAAERIGAHGLALAARKALDSPIGDGFSPVSAEVERALLFTDITGSTDLNVAVGDDRFVALLEEHNQVLRHCVTSHGGVIFHNTGDGYGAWFSDATDAVAAATAIHRDLRAAAARHPNQVVSVRIGIACGTPTSVGGDLFGVDVVRAARLCSIADAEAVVIDLRTAERFGSRSSLPLHSLGDVALKGFPIPEPAFRIQFNR